MHLNITKKINYSREIGIISFLNDKITSNIDNIANIIASDLQNTGKFHPLCYPQLNHGEKNNCIFQTTINEWLNVDIDILILGKICKTHNNQYTISYELVDISRIPIYVILKYQHTVTQMWIRYAAHTISNNIFKKLTGIKGAFCTRIAYITRINNTKYPYKLYISDYDGHNEILVFHSKEPIMSPTWSPSGHQLVYVIFVNNRSLLVIHDLTIGSIRELINFSKHNGSPSFSHNGEQLAVSLSQTGSLNLYVMNLISNKIQQITNERSNNTEPSWFPDNKTLTYTSDRTGVPQIYKINIDNTDCFPKKLSWENFKNQNSIVSSNGKFLIMISSNNHHQNVTKLDLSTGKYQKLTNTVLDETLTLAPNDDMIIFSTLEEQNSKLYLLSIDGSYKTQLPIKHKYVRFPTWSPYIE